MKIDHETEDIEGPEGDEERLVSISFTGSREELDEFGNLFIDCAKDLKAPNPDSRVYQVSQKFLSDFGVRFKELPTSVCVSLDLDDA